MDSCQRHRPCQRKNCARNSCQDSRGHCEGATQMRHEEFDKRFPAWLNNFLNKWPWCLDEDNIKSFAVVWGFKREGKWQWILERAPNDGAQFYNGIACLRLNWPIGIFFQVRWSGSTTRKSLLQFGLGWKVIGRIGPIFRQHGARALCSWDHRRRGDPTRHGAV